MDFLKHNVKPEEPAAQPGQEKSLLDKFGGALQSQIQPTPPHAPAPQSALRTEGLFGNVGDALQYASRITPTPPPPPPTPVKEDTNLFDKLNSLVGGDHHPAPAPAPRQEGLLEKVGDALHHASTPTPAPVKEDASLLGKIASVVGGDLTSATTPVPPKQEGLLGKIGEALGVENSAPEPPKSEGLLGKIGDMIGGKHEEPTKPMSLAGKIDQALGGGAASEKNEDYLDKTIDFFQEHVLRQGAQDNELALEQLKDKEIADVIKRGFKRTTGFDLPGTKH